MKTQPHRPESKVPRPDKNLATSPEPQKLLQPIPPTPKQISPPTFHNIAPEKAEITNQSDKPIPQKPPLSNPEVPEKELLPPSPSLVSYLSGDTFERKFELAIKNKQNKGNLPSRKIDIYLNKDSNSQNDFYAVKSIECDSMDSIAKHIQSLMVLNHLKSHTDVCLKVHYYTMNLSERKPNNAANKKSEPQNLLSFTAVMELAESNLGDDMVTRKNKKTPYSKFELYCLAENLIAVMGKLEKLRVPHGNLKPENFMLVKGKYKLMDFNGTIYENNHVFKPDFNQITTKYVPEDVRAKVEEGQEFEINYYKLDVFGLGAILLECAENNDSEEILVLNKEKIIERINKIAGKYDGWFIGLLQKMLEAEENERIEMGAAQEFIGKLHEEIQKQQFEVKKPKNLNSKKDFSKSTTMTFNSRKKEEPLVKKIEKPKPKGEFAPRKIPNRSNTPESPIKDLEGPDSRYSSAERKKNKVEITHSKVTSYVSPRAQKNMNSFKFPIKNEQKKAKTTGKNQEEAENRDIYKEFFEKLNKVTNLKTVNFGFVLNHFAIDQLHYDKNVFYQKYADSAEAKMPKKIVTENKRKDGKVVRFYSDHSQEISFNNGARKMVFPDSYSIIYFLNNDIKQTFPYEMTIYYYADSQTTQITYEKIGINIYQFKNEQLELHHSDGRIEIRLADGTEKHLVVANTK